MAARSGNGKLLLAWGLPMTDAVSSPLAIVVLAAGKGTRMKSDLHKVLHPIAGRPMLEHLLASAAQLAPERQVVVAGHGREQLEAARWRTRGDRRAGPAARHRPRGAAGRSALAGLMGDVLVLYGDVPFVSADTMRAMLERLHAADAPAVVVLGFRTRPIRCNTAGSSPRRPGREDGRAQGRDEAERACRCAIPA
jgi:bifunctional UDP-N-acetylglucosamine pyrophosphorylase / glucosamine-1-phosphate N-acetyltransferase